jgi:hypothetical protein
MTGWQKKNAKKMEMPTPASSPLRKRRKSSLGGQTHPFFLPQFLPQFLLEMSVQDFQDSIQSTVDDELEDLDAHYSSIKFLLCTSCGEQLPPNEVGAQSLLTMCASCYSKILRVSMVGQGGEDVDKEGQDGEDVSKEGQEGDDVTPIENPPLQTPISPTNSAAPPPTLTPQDDSELPNNLSVASLKGELHVYF